MSESWLTKELLKKMEENSKKRDEEWKVDKKIAHLGTGFDSRKYMEKDVVFDVATQKQIRSRMKSIIKAYFLKILEEAKKQGKKVITMDIVNTVKIAGVVIDVEVVKKKVEEKLQKQFKAQEESRTKKQERKAKRIARLEAEISKAKGK